MKTIDIISGIAQASMEMASARVTTGAQVAVLKHAMDTQQEVAASLLETLGVGQNLSIKA